MKDELQKLRKTISRKDLSNASIYENKMEVLLKANFNFASRPFKENSDLTLFDYLKSKPISRNETRQSFHLQKLGKFTDTENEAIDKVLEYIKIFFRIPIKILEDLSEDLLTNDSKLKFGDETGVDSDYLIYNLIPNFVPKSSLGLIVITRYHLYCGEREQMLLGCALKKFRSVLWSTALFDIEETKNIKVEFKKEIEKFLKLAIHEMGHVISLPHCEKYECIMGIVHYQYLDEYPASFCPNCLSKLFCNLKLDELDWLKEQEEFWLKNNYKENSKFYSKLIGLIEKS